MVPGVPTVLWWDGAGGGLLPSHYFYLIVYNSIPLSHLTMLQPHRLSLLFSFLTSSFQPLSLPVIYAKACNSLPLALDFASFL